MLIAAQLVLNFLSDDTVVSAQAQSTSWWAWSTSATLVTLWTWSTLLAVDTVAAWLTLWTLTTLLTWATAVAHVTWEAWLTVFAWVTWLAWGTWVTWLTVSTWVAWGAWWAAETGLTLWTWLAWCTIIAWLTVVAWVAWGTSWTWLTSGTWHSHLTTSTRVWTLWTWWTLGTWSTWLTWLTLSTVWCDIVAALTWLTWVTWATWATWLTVGTGSTWLTVSAWWAGFAWWAWWTSLTLSTTWTLHLIAFASATSNSALWQSILLFAHECSTTGGRIDTVLPAMLGALIVRFDIEVGATSTDSVRGGEVSGQKLHIWAAGEASLWHVASVSNGLDVDVDLLVLKASHSVIKCSFMVCANNTLVGDNVKDSSSVRILGASSELLSGLGKTFMNIVTLTLVLAGCAGETLGSQDLLFYFLENPVVGEFFEFAASDVIGFFGVRVDRHLHGLKLIDSVDLGLIVVGLDDLGGLLNEHTCPELLGTSGTVQKDNNFNVAFLALLWIDIMAALTLAVALCGGSVPITKLANRVSGESLGSSARDYYE